VVVSAPSTRATSVIVTNPTHYIFQTGSAVHPTSYPMGTGGSFPEGKAAGEWSWPLTSNQCRGQEKVDLYIDSPKRLHGVVFNLLNTEATLPYLICPSSLLHVLHLILLYLASFDNSCCSYFGRTQWSYVARRSWFTCIIEYIELKELKL
jgi:hypothetical protein